MNKHKAILYSLLMLVLGAGVGYCLGLNTGLDRAISISDPSVLPQQQPAPTSPATPVIPNENNKTYTDPASGASFNYPASLGLTYISTVTWPPKLAISDQSFACVASSSAVPGQAQSEKRIIGGQEFCLTTSSEGAAGSIYIDRVYSFAKDNQTVSLAFTVRQVQCANYDEPQQSACAAETQAFDADAIIKEIATSLRWK